MMMKFRTEIDIKPTTLQLCPEKPILMTGSCFADNMTRMLRRGRWDAVNPLGVLFNPLSIAENLRMYILSDNPDEEFKATLFESGGRVLSWSCDSSGAASTIEASIEAFTLRRETLLTKLSAGATLCVTFGTAFCYFLSSQPDRVVANCHKQPAALFTRRRIEPQEISETWINLATQLKERFPPLNIIFTVSPVRHLRDGIHENTLSKSILHLATDEICRKLDYCHYFPAYELLCDDLRDYRFYAEDMAHPSEQAVEYIWEKFRDAYIDARGKEMLREGEALTRRMNHRPIIPDTPEAIEFQQKTEQLAEAFLRKYPYSIQ